VPQREDVPGQVRTCLSLMTASLKFPRFDRALACVTFYLTAGGRVIFVLFPHTNKQRRQTTQQHFTSHHRSRKSLLCICTAMSSTKKSSSSNHKRGSTFPGCSSFCQTILSSKPACYLVSLTEAKSGTAHHHRHRHRHHRAKDHAAVERSAPRERKTFPSTEGGIPPSCYTRRYVIQRQEPSAGLLSKIKEGRYVLLHGHRMCGKTTHVLQLIEQQKNVFLGI
jgi:hypothetical protein